MKNLIIVVLVLILIFALCAACSSPEASYVYDLVYAQDKLIEKIEGRGLSNAIVVVTPYKDYDKSKFCTVEIACEDFESLKGSDMYDFFVTIDDTFVSGSKLLWLDTDITITSGGHVYTYEAGYEQSGRSGYVYRDGKQFYVKGYQKGNSGSNSGNSQSAADSGARHTDAEAWACAQNIVEGNLKSPSTAKFCKITEATITHSGDKYTVKGWVDAQNSFGATVRQNFTVTYTATAKGYKNGMVTIS